MRCRLSRLSLRLRFRGRVKLQLCWRKWECIFRPLSGVTALLFLSNTWKRVFIWKDVVGNERDVGGMWEEIMKQIYVFDHTVHLVPLVSFLFPLFSLVSVTENSCYLTAQSIYLSIDLSIYLSIYLSILSIYLSVYTLKNAGLNTTQSWVKYGRLGCFRPSGWVTAQKFGLNI